MTTATVEPVISTGMASEGSHWYNRKGESVYEVERADKKGMRAATLRDARKLNLLPGVSSISRCAAAPGLERWKQHQVLMAALTLPRVPHEPEKSWIDRIMADSQEQAKRAAELGTAIHKAIELSFALKPYDPAYKLHVDAVKDAIYDHFGAMMFATERSFACRRGYGGKTDLVSTTIGKHLLIDVKSKDFETLDVQLAYDDHLIQNAAYADGLELPDDATLVNLFVSRNKPGLVSIHTWTADERKRGSAMFNGLLAYWKADRNYDPSW